MALVVRGWEYVVSLMDSGYNTTTKTFQLRASTAAEALAAATVINTELAAVSDAQIVMTRLSEVREEDAISPTAGSQVETVASVTGFISGAGSKKTHFEIPAPKSSLFVATSGSDSNIVNLSGAVSGYASALFQAGGVAYISDGEILGALIKGVRASKGRRQA